MSANSDVIEEDRRYWKMRRCRAHFDVLLLIITMTLDKVKYLILRQLSNPCRRHRETRELNTEGGEETPLRKNLDILIIQLADLYTTKDYSTYNTNKNSHDYVAHAPFKCETRWPI